MKMGDVVRPLVLFVAVLFGLVVVRKACQGKIKQVGGLFCAAGAILAGLASALARLAKS
jgi:hypothetical protein